MIENRIVVIGLDGMGWNLLNKLIEKDVMKNIGEIVNKSFTSDLISTIPPVTAPAWTSFATGMSVGNHGLYDFYIPNDSPNNLRLLTSYDVTVPVIPQIVRLRNKKSIIINLPGAYPPKTDDIYLISYCTMGKDYIFPKNILDKYPMMKEYKSFPDHSLYMDGLHEKFIKNIRNIERRKFNYAKELFRSSDWDFFFILFSGTDWCQHKYFKELHHEVNNKIKKEKVLEFYNDIDKFVKWFYDNLDEKMILFIISDHGFKEYKGIINGSMLLKEWYYLKVQTKLNNRSSSNHNNPKSISNITSKLFLKYPRIYQTLNKPFVSRIIKKILRNDFVSGVKNAAEDIIINEELSKAFCCASGGIYLNEKYFNKYALDLSVKNNLKREIIEKLRSLKESKTGNKIFDIVTSCNSLYPGNHKNIPDIICFSNSYTWNYSFRTPYLKKITPTGAHSLKGILICNGQDIKNKKNHEKPIKIIDIAPTLLYLLGIEIPHELFDGRIIYEMLGSSYLNSKKKLLNSAEYNKIIVHNNILKILNELKNPR